VERTQRLRPREPASADLQHSGPREALVSEAVGSAIRCSPGIPFGHLRRAGRGSLGVRSADHALERYLEQVEPGALDVEEPSDARPVGVPPPFARHGDRRHTVVEQGPAADTAGHPESRALGHRVVLGGVGNSAGTRPCPRARASSHPFLRQAGTSGPLLTSVGRMAGCPDPERVSAPSGAGGLE